MYYRSCAKKLREYWITALVRQDPHACLGFQPVIELYMCREPVRLDRNSVLSEMSFEQEFDVPSTSSTMLNLRTLPDTGVPKSSGESGILSLAVKSLTEMITGEEKFEKQSIKFARQISSSKEVEEAFGTELEGSVTKNDVVSNKQQTPKADKELKIISLDELAWHDTPDNCWFAIYDYVYDCTSFIKDHPGGDDVLLEYAGRDATLAFIGAGHSKFAQKALERYLIGELPPNERIFRIDGGVKVYGF